MLLNSCSSFICWCRAPILPLRTNISLSKQKTMGQNLKNTVQTFFYFIIFIMFLFKDHHLHNHHAMFSIRKTWRWKALNKRSACRGRGNRLYGRWRWKSNLNSLPLAKGPGSLHVFPSLVLRPRKRRLHATHLWEMPRRQQEPVQLGERVQTCLWMDSRISCAQRGERKRLLVCKNSQILGWFQKKALKMLGDRCIR